jgi:hypothetical protein
MDEIEQTNKKDVPIRILQRTGNKSGLWNHSCSVDELYGKKDKKTTPQQETKPKRSFNEFRCVKCNWYKPTPEYIKTQYCTFCPDNLKMLQLNKRHKFICGCGGRFKVKLCCETVKVSQQCYKCKGYVYSSFQLYIIEKFETTY